MTEPLVSPEHRIRVSIECDCGEVATRVLEPGQARRWAWTLLAAVEGLVPTDDLDVCGSGESGSG